MSLLFRKSEQRSISYVDVWGRGEQFTPSGDPLSLVPVYAATGLIADQFSASPWAAYTKDSGGVPTRARRQPQLVTDPGFCDIYTWKHQAIVSCLLRGNAYGYVTDFAPNGNPAKVLWLNPDSVRVDETQATMPRYFFNGAEIPKERVIHIPAYVQPGSVVGLSPLGLFKAQIETNNQAQNFGKNWFKRGGIPSGVLRNSQRTLTPEAADTVKKRFKASVSATEPFVTGNDWEYTPITIPGGEAQFISALKLTATQFAAIYRVAPEDVGGEVNGTSLTYKNLEQDQIRFAMRTLRPWTTRFEAVLSRYLSDSQYVKFNLDASARADLKTRMESHALALASGVETLDEARAFEERPPLTPAQLKQFMDRTRPAAPAVAEKGAGDAGPGN